MMTSPEQVTRSVLLADGCDMNHNVQALANEIVRALRDAGYLIEGGERETQYMNRGWETDERYKATDQRDVIVGPWRPVEEEDGK